MVKSELRGSSTMAGNKWLVGSLVLATACVALVVIHLKNKVSLLQKNDPLEARLHRDLRANDRLVPAGLPRRIALKGKKLSNHVPKPMLQQAFVEMGKDNKMLRHEVEDLQRQSMIMAQVLKAYTQQQKGAPKARKTQGLAAIDTPMATKWWTDNHPGGGTLKTTLDGIQENPLDLITSEDPTLDPYDPNRHYLRAPQPHDPASSLVKSVTGDYASPMTYKDIVNNKRTIDWCVTNYDFVTDREKCIEKINKGPLLM